MKILVKLTLALTVAAYTYSVLATEYYETLSASPGETLNLRTDAGSLEINTHSKNEVIVEVDVSGPDAEDFDVTIEKRGDEVIVIGEKENRNRWNGLRVKFEITVPKTFELDLRTAGGSIEIDDLIGNIDASTSGGSIAIGDIEGDVELHTSGGSIRTDDIVGEIDAHTSGGSIEVTFAKQPTQDASLTTSGGSIRAYLPEDVAIELNASTSGGRVRTEFDVTGRVKKQSIRGDINGGGPELTLRTSGGSVSVNKR